MIIRFWNNNQMGQIIPLNYKNFEFKLKKKTQLTRIFKIQMANCHNFEAEK